MNEKKGFTLVELLAVIVILAIILAIAIPGISGIIKSSTKGAFKSDAKMVLTAINYQKIQNDAFDVTSINKDTVLSTLKLSNDNYESVTTTLVNNKVKVVIVGKNKWAGLTACGSYQNMTVSEEGCELDLVSPVITLNGENPMEIGSGDAYTELGASVSDNSGESIEVIITGSVNTSTMGAYTITYTATDSSGNTTTTTRTVNVVVPNYAGPSYKSSKGVNGPVLAQGMTPIKWDGSAWIDTTENDENWYSYAATDKQWANIRTADGSMWVWIPRYAYQIATNYHTSTAGTINIKFLKGNTNTASDSTQIYEDNASNTHFVKHPAFDFGGTQLTGIWVAKFEMSGTTASLDSKPGVSSLRSLTAGNMFTSTRNMETNNKYGWALSNGLNTDGTFTTDTNGVDTHMMKNMEWGAVAYLSQSTYGKNAEIAVNSNSSYYTGGGSGTAYTTNVSQSTTGTIYGIYDISGGAHEYVMGNYNNTAGSSDLTPSSINNKYIDRYTAYDSTKYGDALYETSTSASGITSWYSDYSNMLEASYPWFGRGGHYDSGSIAGAFCFYSNTGAAGSNYSWRSVVLTSEGL